MKLPMTLALVASLTFFSGCSQPTPPVPTPVATAVATQTPSPVPQGPQVGDEVAVPWGEAFYQPRTITAINGEMATVEDQSKKSREVKLAECKMLAPKDWEVGEEVLALGYSQFDAALITAKKDDDTYTIKWRKGDKSADVVKKYILPFELLSEPEVPGELNGKAEAGSIVAVQSSGPNLYIGTVESVEGEKAKVLYFRGNLSEVSTADLKPFVVKEWAMGDKVFAIWSPGGLMSAGVVGEKIGDDTYIISFDAGGPDKRVSARRMVAR